MTRIRWNFVDLIFKQSHIPWIPERTVYALSTSPSSPDTASWSSLALCWTATADLWSADPLPEWRSLSWGCAHQRLKPLTRFMIQGLDTGWTMLPKPGLYKELEAWKKRTRYKARNQSRCSRYLKNNYWNTGGSKYSIAGLNRIFQQSTIIITGWWSNHAPQKYVL